MIFWSDFGNDNRCHRCGCRFFRKGVTHISSEIAFQCQDGNVCYFNGHLPVFIHEKDDLATFRMFSSQLVINGSATQAQIARAFGVPLVTVKRCVKLAPSRWGAGFFLFHAPSARRGNCGPWLQNISRVRRNSQALGWFAFFGLGHLKQSLG